MAGIVDNILGFSRSRTGEGWLADIKPENGLKRKLEQTIKEHMVSAQGRTIEGEFNLQTTVPCDSTMILQVAANLLTNALTHGHPEQPISIKADTDEDKFTLSVRNFGNQIPQSELSQIFRPFAQTGNREKRRKGLGLGLHIVSEIATAHKGTVRVESDEKNTTFTFSIPIPASRRIQTSLIN